jgi:hypothetical protein
MADALPVAVCGGTTELAVRRLFAVTRYMHRTCLFIEDLIEFRQGIHGRSHARGDRRL